MTPEERILVLETILKEKLEQLTELEKRVAKLEKAIWAAFGGLTALQLILKFAH